jgi:hypothetical protein
MSMGIPKPNGVVSLRESVRHGSQDQKATKL